MNAPAAERELRPAILPQWLRGLLPAWLKPAVRAALCAAADLWAWSAGERDPLLPPARLRVRVGCFASYIRRGRYREVAREFAGHLSSLAGLGPASRVLDVGCGCGQMAAPLVAVLGPEGRYQGIDPDGEMIAWCREAIARRDARFGFTHADLANTLYNPAGRLGAEEFRFPYDDAAFDVILLKSVFTHLSAAAMRRYLAEVRRLLLPGGRCLVSGYFVDAQARARMQAGRAAYRLRPDGDGRWILDPANPDYVTAHEEASLREGAARAGLRLVDPIHRGAWSGRRTFTSFQDLVVMIPDAR